MAQITIIGLGTIGQSLGLALHRYMQTGEGQAAQFTVVGYDPDLDQREAASVKAGTVDRLVGDLPAAVRDAPFVIIAMPTWRIYETLRAVAPHLAAGATVTDTAPNKRLVLRWAGELLPPGINFVGGHPLPRRIPAPAILSDDVIDEPPAADLFQDAPYCLMPLASASEAALNQVIAMAEAVGAKPYFTDPLEHDTFQAAIHDLPVLTSFALMGVLESSASWRDISGLAGAAFREGTRMASSDPQAVRAEVVANREYLLGWIDRYQGALQDLRDQIAASDPADLEQGTGRELGAALTAGHRARTVWLNPNAAPEAQAKQAGPEVGGHSFVRSIFGGFFADYLSGTDRPRRDDKNRR